MNLVYHPLIHTRIGGWNGHQKIPARKAAYTNENS